MSRELCCIINDNGLREGHERDTLKGNPTSVRKYRRLSGGATFSFDFFLVARSKNDENCERGSRNLKRDFQLDSIEASSFIRKHLPLRGRNLIVESNGKLERSSRIF